MIITRGERTKEEQGNEEEVEVRGSRGMGRSTAAVEGISPTDYPTRTGGRSSVPIQDFTIIIRLASQETISVRQHRKNDVPKGARDSRYSKYSIGI